MSKWLKGNKIWSIDSSIEEYKLQHSQMFMNSGFMASIMDENEQIVFSPYMVSNFSVDKNKICVTLYDLIQDAIIEEELDRLSKGFWIWKPCVTIVLMRLDSHSKEVYTVKYNKCKLNNYHGKNFTYKEGEPYQWYLEFSFSNKDIVKNKDFEFSQSNNDDVSKFMKYFYPPCHKRNAKRESDDKKKETVKKTNKTKAENEEKAMQFLNMDIRYHKLKDIEMDLAKELNDLENKIDI